MKQALKHGVSQFYYKGHIVVVGTFVSYSYAALFAFKEKDKVFFRVGQSLYRAQYTIALVCSVTRHNIHVKRRQTIRTMVARGVA